MKKSFSFMMLILIFQNTKSITRLPNTNNSEEQQTLYNIYTESIANEINYYGNFRKLRAMASNHLRKLDRNIREYLQNLRFNYKYHQASSYEQDLKNMLINLELKFSALFQAADESFLLIAKIMNENDNPHDEKIIFINRAKNDLNRAVSKLIKESTARFANAFN